MNLPMRCEQKLNALGIPLTVAPNQTQFGASLGGPLKRDKLFFFTSYEQQIFDINRSVAYTTLAGFVPSAVQAENPFSTYTSTQTPYNQTNDAKTFLAKIDWNINNSNRFNIRYNYSRTRPSTVFRLVRRALIHNVSITRDKWYRR